MSIRTSKPYSRNHEIIEGIYWESVGLAVLGALIAMSLVYFLSLKGFSSQFITLVVMIFVPYKCWQFSQKMMSGSYPFAGLEDYLVRRKGRYAVDVIDFSEQIKMKKKDDFVFSSNGKHIYGFRVKENIEPLELDADIRSVLEEIQMPHEISFMRDADEIKTGKDLEAKINECQLYVFLEIDPTVKSAIKTKSDLSALIKSFADPLSTDEIMRICRNIFLKSIDPEERIEVPGFFASPVSLIREEALAHLGQIDERVMGLSMAELPESVSPRFQLLFDTIGSLPSTIHVQFTPLMQQNPFLKYLDKLVISKAEKNELTTVHIGSRCNLKMSITALAHGTKEELKDLEDRLRRQSSKLPGDEYTKFPRDNAILKEVILSILPGNDEPLPNRRRFRVLNLDEAVHYLPRPVEKGVSTPLLTMRTTSNTLFNFALNPAKPLYCWAGMGEGKTAFFCSILLAHLRRKSELSDKPMAYVLTAGDGYHWLLDGLADATMIYASDEKTLRWKPLSFHPLQAFFSLGSLAIEPAAAWLCHLTGTSDANINNDIRRILGEMQTQGESRMSEFYQRFEALVFEKWPDSTTKPDHYSRNLLSRLRNYCRVDGSQYGYVFEPETADEIDFKKVRVFYVTQEKALSERSEFLSGFFDLATNLAIAWDLVVNNPTLMLVDELAHLFEIGALTEKRLDSLNSQGRKQVKYVAVGSQRLADIENLSKDLLRSFKHFIFYGEAEQSTVEEIMGAGSEESRKKAISAFERAMATLRYVRKRRGQYAWGYLDTDQRLHHLIHDLDGQEKWLIGSDGPARKLKREIQETFGLSYFETAKMLDLYGPSKVPQKEEEYPNPKVVELIYGRIIKHIT